MTSPNPRSTFSAICISNGVVRVRTRATVGPRNCVDYSRASASHSNPVAILPTPGGGPLRRSVEPTRTLMAPLLRIFSRGPREILNLVGAFKALRSLSSNALVQHPEKSGRSVAQTFRISPVPVLSLVAVHAVNLTEDRKHEVPKKCGF